MTCKVLPYMTTSSDQLKTAVDDETGLDKAVPCHGFASFRFDLTGENPWQGAILSKRPLLSTPALS